MTDGNDARTQLSEMTEITEHTIDRTFHRDGYFADLYRECPTAFWLAPDGDDALPPPPPGPVMPAPRHAVEDRTPDDPPHVVGMTGGIARAALIAGPTFAATGLMLSQSRFDEHWWDPFGRALMSLIGVPLTVPVGGVLALLPVLIGVLSLGEAGTRFPVVRDRRAWALTGGAMGLAIAALFDAGGAVALALVATSIACAVVARNAVSWAAPEYA